MTKQEYSAAHVLEGEGEWSIETRNSLEAMRELPDGSVDAVIADCPYSSGGFMRGDRMGSTKSKYSKATKPAPDFEGDTRDQRGFEYWCTLWYWEALRVVKPGGLLFSFTDWRQLPTTTDAVQAGGWVWRGIVPWYKPSHRRQSGRPSAACEYVVWGTRGPRPIEGPQMVGFYQESAPKERIHQTQKPLGMLCQIVSLVPPGGVVLDPFAGSGSTILAAAMTGRRGIGFELSDELAREARGNVRGGLVAQVIEGL